MDNVVRRARHDTIAFGQLFDQFYPTILAFAMRRLLVRASAEDVTSEVFVKIAGAIGNSSVSTLEHFRRWLFRIATNEINAELRKSSRRRELLETAANLGYVGGNSTHGIIEIDASTRWSDLYAAIQQLDEREQSIIALRFFEDLKHNQIARILNIKTGTVRVALSRALNKLRDHLRNLETPPNCGIQRGSK